jgi:hypothetical protein
MATIVRFPRLHVQLGELVHHDEFGAGTISRIWGYTLTISVSDGERDLPVDCVVTRAQAEEQWRETFLRGLNHRLELGRRLWAVRNLCSRRGGPARRRNGRGSPCRPR